MTTIADLKKNSKAYLDKLKEDVKSQSKRFAEDERYWRPTTDKAGNGWATIRFLPAPYVDGDEGKAYVTNYSHGFKGPGGWYIENSLTTFNEKDPVSEHNSKLWATGIEENKQKARDQKRRTNYFSNILVINDPAVPENNGKVFIFRYGKKLFETKIRPLMFPEEGTGEKEENPFDFWEGRNFLLKVKRVSNFPNFDESKFLSPSRVCETDKELDALWKSEHSLLEILDRKNYKSYDELKERLVAVLGDAGGYERAPGTTSPRTTKPASADETPPWNETPASALDDDMDLKSILADIVNDD